MQVWMAIGSVGSVAWSSRILKMEHWPQFHQWGVIKRHLECMSRQNECSEKSWFGLVYVGLHKGKRSSLFCTGFVLN